MQVFPIKDDFPPQFYDEFARLAVAFGRLEYLIKLCVKDLHAEGFTKGMVEAESRRQFSNELCKRARQLAGQKLCPGQASAFSELIGQAEALAEFRNDTVHAVWTTDSDGQPRRLRPRRDKTTKLVDWSGTRLVPVSEIRSKREEIERLYQTLEAERQTWSISAT